MARMRAEASLLLSCYMIGLRLSQIARLRLRMGDDQSRDTVLALRGLIASLCTAIQKLSSQTSLERTTFARFTIRQGFRLHLNPILYDDAERFADSIFHEFWEVLDQLFPSNPARAESLKKWAKLGWVIPALCRWLNNPFKPMWD